MASTRLTILKLVEREREGTGSVCVCVEIVWFISEDGVIPSYTALSSESVKNYGFDRLLQSISIVLIHELQSFDWPTRRHLAKRCHMVLLQKSEPVPSG